MESAVWTAVSEWSRWVEELADHPLDEFEYEALLQIRDVVADQLQISGSVRARSSVDEADAEFERITQGLDGSGGRSASRRWWRDRVPTNPRWRAYMERSYPPRG
jgi:hypothetical protein